MALEPLSKFMPIITRAVGIHSVELETFEVSRETEERWKNSLKISQQDLVKIFEIDGPFVLERLEFWKQRREELSKEICKRLEMIKNKAKDEFSKFFFREYLKIEYAQEIVEVRKQTMRLENLLSVLRNKRLMNSITDDQIYAAKSFPIENLFDQPLRKSGQALKGLCPFHEEKTPSFFVFGNNRYKCFGCGESGDVINFIQRKEKISFIEAVRYLQR